MKKTQNHNLSQNLNDFENNVEQKLESQSFWTSERILFLANLAIFFTTAVILYFTERNNPKNVGYNSFVDFLFNSVSIGTLTGLFRGDSGNYGFWGQFALLGNMTISAIIAGIVSILLILFVRVGLDRTKTLENELHRIGINTPNIISFLFVDLILIWSVGTLLFYFSGTRTGWEAIFNSASHIFNDGVTTFTGNMVPYKNNVSMLLSGIFLITIGGFGLGIRGLFYKWFLNLIGFKKIATKIPDSVLAPKNFAWVVVGVSLLLQLLGASFLYNFENSNPKTFGDGSFNSNIQINSWYMSVSSRTAGFSTISRTLPNGDLSVDLADINDKSVFILIVLMSIGASSGSFAGGILKLTALMYLFVFIYSRFKGYKDVKTAKGFVHFSEKTAIEANFRVIGFTSIVVILTSLLFLIEENISGMSLLFESFSAVTNTGLTTGATGSLGTTSMFIIMLLMIIGKIGFISFIISFSPKLQKLISETNTDADEFPVD